MCKQLKRIHLKELMQDSKKIIIEHDNKSYLLSVTRKGKLILTAAKAKPI